jgi:endoglucanase
MEKKTNYLPMFISTLLTTLFFMFCVSIKTSDDVLPRIKHKRKFESSNLYMFPQALFVANNQILTVNNKATKLVGIMGLDLSVMHERDPNNKNYLEEYINKVKNSGASIIRVPIHPRFWNKDNDYLWRYLDPIVEVAGKKGIYVDICWQSIGNIDDGYGYEMSEDGKTKELTYKFWNLVAEYFNNTPNVLFEIFNEPQNISNASWAKNAKEIVNYIREINKSTLLIVGSTEMCSNLNWIKDNKISSDNIVYSVHIYPNHNWESWDSLFGSISKEVPVFMTEWGFMIETEVKSKNQWFLYSDENSYGIPLMKYLNDHGINWIACWYDYEWEPPMIEVGTGKLNRYGKFVFEQLKKYSKE